jgi:hypothetical protein
MSKHTISSDSAEKVWGWMKDRGGISVWPSVNFANLNASWTTPINASKPTWEADNKPSLSITDASEIVVSIDREVKRFHVAVRIGSQGLTLKLTDASGKKVRAAVEKAGEGASYIFDYATQEAVIFAPSELVPLPEYIERIKT